LRLGAGFQWVPDSGALCQAVAEIWKVAPRRVAAGRLVWIDPVRRDASPEERRGDSGRFLGRDALAGIFQVVLLAATLRVSAHWEHPSRESKTLLDALRQAQAVVPATLLGRMAAGSGSQFSAQ
jgi:hypothetical protein